MLNHLKNIPLFNSLQENELTSILDQLEQVSYPVYTKIFETGDRGDCLYIILEGEVEVFIEGNETSEKIVLSSLVEGDYFGEMALITGEPRSASVRTLTDCKLLRLGKTEFDQLIINNPSISISLSHMLSQRLKNANIKRAEAESIYQAKMKPSGKLEDIPVFEVLKFCEQNSLTGILKINSDNNHAELGFTKGQLQEVTYNNLLDDQAMDAILTWKQGNFQIEPSILEIENKNMESVSDIDEISDDPLAAIEYFSQRLVYTLITIVGSRTVQQLITKTNDSLLPFFPKLENVKIDVGQEVKISFSESQKLSDKDILSIGVFLQVIIENCKQFTIGMSFLNLSQLAGPYFRILENNSFFEYMAHAKEFVNP